MTKHEFLRQLEMNLMIGEEEKEEVMRYYSEYFEDAGPENEQEVLAELGDPVALARKLTAECEGELARDSSAAQSERTAGNAAQGQSAETRNAEPSGQSSEASSGAYRAESGTGGASRSSDRYSYNSWGKWGRDLGAIINEAVQSAMSAAGVIVEEAEAAEREALREVEAAQREAMREAEAAGRDMARAAREAGKAAKEAGKAAGKAVRETARQSRGTVFTSLKDILNGGSGSELYYFSNMDMEPFTDICVDVRNCAVSVEKSLDGRYGVEAQLAARQDDEIIVKVENGLLTVKQKNQSHRWNWGIQMGNGQRQDVRLILPEAEYNRIDLNTSNARVEVYDLSTVRELLNIDTSNGQIILENVTADEQIRLDSSNGSISAKQVCGREITADTSNSQIILEQVLSEKVVADTSNGGIRVKNCEITGLLNADTSNGSIEVWLPGQESDYSVHADTSNSKIYVDGRSVGSEYNTRGGVKAVRLDTSNGRITIGYMG